MPDFSSPTVSLLSSFLVLYPANFIFTVLPFDNFTSTGINLLLYPLINLFICFFIVSSENCINGSSTSIYSTVPSFFFTGITPLANSFSKNLLTQNTINGNKFTNKDDKGIALVSVLTNKSFTFSTFKGGADITNLEA